MLSRQYRLRRRSDFGHVYRRGRVVHAHTFSLKYGRNHLEHPRVAVVVSTKVSKKAVTRNRLRRRFYAQIRELLPLVKPGSDIIILVRASAIDQDSHSLGKDLASGLKKAGLLHESPVTNT